MNHLQIQQWIKKNKKTFNIWLVLVGISFVFTFLQYTGQKTKHSNTQNIDTYIPLGFVLVPIELHNGDSLDGLLQTKGVVDLYTKNNDDVKKIATAIKIIRSPRNHSHFAVLVPVDKAYLLIKQSKTFYAVIQHPNPQQKTNIRTGNKKKSRSITIEVNNIPLEVDNIPSF